MKYNFIKLQINTIINMYTNISLGLVNDVYRDFQQFSVFIVTTRYTRGKKKNRYKQKCLVKTSVLCRCKTYT